MAATTIYDRWTSSATKRPGCSVIEPPEAEERWNVSVRAKRVRQTPIRASLPATISGYPNRAGRLKQLAGLVSGETSQSSNELARRHTFPQRPRPRYRERRGYTPTRSIANGVREIRVLTS